MLKTVNWGFVMYKKDLYNKKTEYDNMTYSVDKIRLKTNITYVQFKELEFMINSVYKENIKLFYVSDRIMKFHYNYHIEFENFSFYFGFMHNNEGVNYNKEDLQYNFTIEFNPNKAKDNRLVLYILGKYPNWYLRSFDLAIDIPINILDLIFDQGNRRKVETHSYGGDNITYRIGTGDGKIKIYNKKRESDLNIVGNLTRVEISTEYNDFPISNIKKFEFNELIFPYLYLNQYLSSFSDYEKPDKTLLAILYAVQAGYNMKDLSRVYRKKIRDLLEGGSRIKFHKKSASEVLQQTIYFYFVRREAKQVIF